MQVSLAGRVLVLEIRPEAKIGNLDLGWKNEPVSGPSFWQVGGSTPPTHLQGSQDWGWAETSAMLWLEGCFLCCCCIC